MGRLEGKSAVVTGGGRGIGRGICLAYAREGADVIVNYATKDQPAQKVVEMIYGMGRKAVAVKGNVAVKADAERIIQAAIDHFGKIDILVNNAGATKPAMLYKMTEDHGYSSQGPFPHHPSSFKIYDCNKKVGRSLMSHQRLVLQERKGRLIIVQPKGV